VSLGTLTLRLRRPPHPAEQVQQLPVWTTAQVPETTDHSHLVTAPMVGTFYTASTPGSQPFVTKGDRIAAGQTIGIIEAMKIMNEITADRSGVVLELLIGNGQPVEYGSPLLRLALDDTQP
jgi:acetyl-CoA carboxylase biotin carboxyl carrier protein